MYIFMFNYTTTVHLFTNNNLPHCQNHIVFTLHHYDASIYSQRYLTEQLIF